MKTSSIVLLLVATLAFSISIAGLFHWHGENQKEAESQALATLDSGIDLFQKKRYSEALEVLETIPEGVLQDWHLPYYTASAQVMLKDFESAAREYDEALALNPGEPRILFALGVTYFKLNKIGLSKSYFAAVLEIDPGNEEAKGLMDIMAKLERGQAGEQDTEEIRSAKSSH